jgi:hypothetical protein
MKLSGRIIIISCKHWIFTCIYWFVINQLIW